MTLSVIFVMAAGNVIVSILRNIIPTRIRIIVQLLVVATLVALGNGVWKSFLDGVGNAAGYGWILIVVAFVRELFGSGELWGVPVIPQFVYDLGYQDNGLMLLSPMALIVVGVYIWIQRYYNRKLIE